MSDPAVTRRSELPWLAGGLIVLLVGWWALNRFALRVYPPDVSEGGKLHVLGWGTDPNPARVEQCNIFNRANRDQGLLVQVVPGGGDGQAIVTRSAAGNAPDCIDVYNPEDLGKYIAKGIARPLNEHLKAAQLDLARETWPALLDNLSRPNPAYRAGVDDPIDARIWYAVPNNVDYPFIYFNRTLWLRVVAERSAAGLTTPPEPWLGWTWWDYAALAKSLNRRGADGRFQSFGGPPPDLWQLAMQVGSGMRGEDRAAFEALTPEQKAARGLANLSWEDCARPFAPRADGTLEPWPNRAALTTALQFGHDLQHAWRAVPTSSDMQQMATGGGYAGTGINGQFLAGTAGMMSMGRWYLMQIRANVSFDWRMVRMPRWVPYEAWARWQREGQPPGRRDGEWGDATHPDRGYLVLMNTRSCFLSSSAKDPAKAFRFLEMLIRNQDYQQVILLEDGSSANLATTLDYVSQADPLIPDEVVNRTPEQELGAVRNQVGRPRWPFSNYARHEDIRWSSLAAWMSPREPLEQALAAGTQLKEVPELAAFAPSERFTSSPVLGQALAARVVTAMDQAGREGFALDQPPRRQGPSLATLGVFGGLAMILGLIAVGAWREKRRQSHG
jgi:ABC-type glycerol-3-phosphate transport system substrate-binding protein